MVTQSLPPITPMVKRVRQTFHYSLLGSEAAPICGREETGGHYTYPPELLQHGPVFSIELA
jgi:hypothetical protein